MSLYLYIKSFLWLAGFGGLGYGLLRITEPSQEKINQIRSIGGSPFQTTEERRKKELLIEKLKEAATGQPIYLKKKGEHKPTE